MKKQYFTVYLDQDILLQNLCFGFGKTRKVRLILHNENYITRTTVWEPVPQ